MAIINATLAGSKGIYAVARELQEIEGNYDLLVIIRRLFLHMRDLLTDDRFYSFRIGVALIEMAYSCEPEFEAIDWTEIQSMYFEFDVPDEQFMAYKTGKFAMDERVRKRLLAFLKKEGEFGITEPTRKRGELP